MSRPASRRRRRLVILAGTLLLLVSVFAGFIVLASPQIACGHSPHDPIDGLAVSPDFAEDQTAFLATRDTLLRSTDGGWEWRQLWNGLTHVSPFNGLAVSPTFAEDGTILATTEGDGIFRSTDRGDTWADSSTGLSDLWVLHVALSPTFATDGRAAAVTADGTLHRSFDGGATWLRVDTGEGHVSAATFVATNILWIGDEAGVITEITDVAAYVEITRLGGVGAITVIVPPPGGESDDATVFVGTRRRGLFRTVDGGATFEAVNTGLTDAARNDPDPGSIDVRSVAFSPNYANDRTVFVSGRDRAPFRSTDGGTTWKTTATGVTCDEQPYGTTQYADAPQYRALAISNGFATDGTVFLAGFDGLFRSGDEGDTWVEVETLPLGIIKGLSVSSSSVIGLATYGGGAYLSETTDLQWQIANKGLETTRLIGIAFSPGFSSDQIAYSGSSGRLLISTDGGASWEAVRQEYSTWKKRVASGLAKARVPTKWMLSEQERKRPYPTVIAPSPAFVEDVTLFWGTRDHGVFRSTDGGRTGSAIGPATEAAINDIVVSPGFTRDGTVFAAMFGRGVFKSEDGGDTWSSVDDGLDFLDDWGSRPRRDDTQEMKIRLTMSPDYENDRTIFLTSSAGLYRSTDGGERWMQFGTEQFGDRYRARAVALSPSFATDRTLLLSVRGRGLFRSRDGGESFTEIGRSLIEAHHVADFIVFSPDGSTVFVASAEELFISADGGDTWRTIPRPVRYENHRDVISYDGSWREVRDENASASSVTVLEATGSTAILRFVGTGITLIGSRGPDQGTADMFIDGQFVARIDQGGARETIVPLLSVDDLDFSRHTIEVVLVNGEFEIDAFDVRP